MYRPINENKGIIIKISPDKTEAWIEAPRGGILKCRNEGFEVGERVCFILDALGNRVLKVLPQDVANIKWQIGQDPILRETTCEIPEDIIEEVELYGSYEIADGGEGPEGESNIDHWGREYRDTDFGAEDHT